MEWEWLLYAISTDLWESVLKLSYILASPHILVLYIRSALQVHWRIWIIVPEKLHRANSLNCALQYHTYAKRKPHAAPIVSDVELSLGKGQRWRSWRRVGAVHNRYLELFQDTTNLWYWGVVFEAWRCQDCGYSGPLCFCSTLGTEGEVPK